MTAVAVVADVFDRVVDLLQGVPDPWIFVIVFAAAAAETALFLGIALPGETVLFVAGYLAYRGVVPVWWLALAAVLGAITGDSIGYEIGRRFGQRIRGSALGRRLGEERWEKADRFMRDHGPAAVFLARFVTGPKSIVPVLAGESRMPYRRFLLWNASSALLWGCFHVGIGYLAGPSVHTVDRWFGWVGWVVLALAVVGAAAYGWWRHHTRRASRSQPAKS